MGSWTLFSFPEIGVLAGTWGVIGYTLSGVLGMLVLGWAGPYTRALLGDGVTLTDWVNNVRLFACRPPPRILRY